MTLALFQKTLAGNKYSQQTITFPGKDLLLFWRACLTKTNFKKIKREKRLENRGNLPKCGCRRDSPVLVTKMFHSFVVNMRWRKSSSLVYENCEEPGLVETGEENSGSDAERLYCSGLYTRDRHCENWIKCTKCYRWKSLFQKYCRFVLSHLSTVQSVTFLNEIQCLFLVSLKPKDCHCLSRKNCFAESFVWYCCGTNPHGSDWRRDLFPCIHCCKRSETWVWNLCITTCSKSTGGETFQGSY